MASNALTCFGVGGGATRVYYLGAGDHVNELAYVNPPGSPLGYWLNTDITAASGAGPAAAGGALTCFGYQNIDARVYYLGNHNQVYELSWQNRWVNTDVSTAAGGAPGLGSPLTCFGFQGTDTRLYYVGVNNHINELSWQNGWVNTDITADLPNSEPAGSGVPAPGSPLTCFGVGGSATRLYYLGAGNVVNEIAWQSGWVNTAINSQALPGSALTCFGVGGTDPRVYYLPQSPYNITGITELLHIADPPHQWGGDTTRATAAPGTPLTCFGAGGTVTRVYFLYTDNHVWELGWDTSPVGDLVGNPPIGWYTTDITAASGAGPAAAGSPLTCFGFQGSATRVYYFDQNNHVNELAWEGHWVNTDITAAARAPAAA
jgi:hypothetical protein